MLSAYGVATPSIFRHSSPVNDASLPRLSSRLRAALEAIYQVFDAATPAVIEGCPCCISTRGTDILLTSPLRQITGTELWRYVSGVFLTIGNERDFRYFLPRILEVSVTDPGNALDPEIVLSKLRLANWRSWSPDVQRAIEVFVDAWFEHAIVSDASDADNGWIGTDSESVLCGAARAAMPLDQWLVRLHDPDAAAVLADMKQRFPGEMSPFWEDVPEAFQQMSTILAQGEA